MKISIAERLKPFSHVPGTRLVLPGSDYVVEVFPTLIKVDEHEIPLNLTGPVKEFTVQLDLEKGCIWVWGFYQEGYHRFCLWSDDGQFRLTQVRGLEKNEAPTLPVFQHERLSLGSHKKQDWCLVKRRGDLKEIIPHWLKLAQFLPVIEKHSAGTVGLIKKISLDKKTLYEDILNLFHLGFDGILNPLLEDKLHLGISVPPMIGNSSSLALITQGAEFLKSLFIHIDQEISLLPALPPQFHCGRFISIDLGGIGKLDMEWSKKIIRRMVFYSAVDQKQTFVFQKEVKNFRLRKDSADRGEIYSAGDSLFLQAQSVYLFDRFQK